MLSVPIPVVASIVLMTLVITHRERLSSMVSGKWFLSLLVIHALSLLLVGVRWALPAPQIMAVLPLLAVVWCVVAWFAFRSLSRDGPVVGPQDWPHVLPVVAVLFTLVAARFFIEASIIACQLFYAALLLRLARHGADRLRLVKFNATRTGLRALWITAALLVVSAGVEFAIWLDFALYRGAHAAQLVALVNVPVLLLLGIAAVSAGQSVTEESAAPMVMPEEQKQPTAPAATTNDNVQDDTTEALINRLQDLLVGQRLYADSELNLQRLARKAGVPARQVSRAVNTHTQLNVSQWVNAARISAACDLLRQTDAPVTEIMHKVGFATKSNFNREFRRATGHSPSVWRSGDDRG